MTILIAETTTDYILYKNEIYYAASSGMNFFSKFDLSCKITKTIDVDMAQIDVITDLSLMGDIEEEFTLNEYAALVIDGSPEGYFNLFITRVLIVVNSGHANEFRLGELVTLTLEFNQLDDNFDYRLNKCWTLDANNDGTFFVVIFRFHRSVKNII